MSAFVGVDLDVVYYYIIYFDYFFSILDSHLGGCLL